MSKTNELVNQVKEPKKQDPFSLVKGYLNASKNEIAKALPKHMTPERMSRIVLTTVKENPKLLECTIPSLMGAVLQASQLGLEPGLLGHCYILPFWNSKERCYNAQFQIGFQGMIDLARRSGQLTQITVQAVHENDEFDYEYGSNQHFKHKPLLGDRGNTIAFYCFTKLENGEESFSIMSLKDVEEHRDKFTKSKDKSGKIYGPWVDDFDAMAKKTVIKQHFKYMPLSIEIREKFSQDETIRKNISEETIEHINYDILPEQETKINSKELPNKPTEEELEDEANSLIENLDSNNEMLQTFYAGWNDMSYEEKQKFVDKLKQ